MSSELSTMELVYSAAWTTTELVERDDRSTKQLVIDAQKLRAWGLKPDHVLYIETVPGFTHPERIQIEALRVSEPEALRSLPIGRYASHSDAGVAIPSTIGNPPRTPTTPVVQPLPPHLL